MLLDRGLLAVKTAWVPFCANCGRDLSPAAVACPSCGHPGPAAAVGGAGTPARRTEGFAIASLASGIAGFFVMPVVGSILAIVFGYAARKRIVQDPALQGAELARAGIIIGWIGAVVGVLAVLFLILLAYGLSHSNF